jgi:hypothetical protein
MDALLPLLQRTHAIYGREVLALIIVAAAIYLSVTYKPEAAPGAVARIFPVLVDIQVGMGILYWVYLLFASPIRDYYLSFPFILHPILGIVAAGLAHMAVGKNNPLRGLGRWAPMASLAVLLLLVLSNVAVVMVARTS